MLIGNETLSRDFVQYEIRKSIEKDNGIIGVKIHGISDMITRRPSVQGNLHTIIWTWSANKKDIYFDEIADGIYDYTIQDGYNNLGSWVESAARKKGK